MRHAVLAHGDFDFHAGVVHIAQHFGNAPDGLAVERGRLGEFNHHNLPLLGASQRVFGQDDVLPVALVFRRQQPQAVFLQQAANDGVGAAFDDLGHAAFRAAFAVIACNARLDAVAVQHGAHFVGGQIQFGGTAVFGDDKTVTIAMALYGSDNFC